MLASIRYTVLYPCGPPPSNDFLFLFIHRRRREKNQTHTCHALTHARECPTRDVPHKRSVNETKPQLTAVICECTPSASFFFIIFWVRVFPSFLTSQIYNGAKNCVWTAPDCLTCTDERFVIFLIDTLQLWERESGEGFNTDQSSCSFCRKSAAKHHVSTLMPHSGG